MASHAPIRKESVLAKTKFAVTESSSADDYVKEEMVTSAVECDRFHSIPEKFSATEKKWMTAILDAKNMDELAALLSNTNMGSMNKRLALTIYVRENDHSTIEFRHFQSTMDYDLAWRWVRITAGIVQLASKPTSEYTEKLELIADEYQAMSIKWKDYLRDRTFGREATDPWLNTWQSTLIMLDLEDDFPFWYDYVAQLSERNRTT
ncbi:hypothetical protein K449DRAFT_433385 [Hypoxylon sp. EC38]|nr:hypothetical protein K449DRAFT_433385 [Hypoxylon sp. EC38]